MQTPQPNQTIKQFTPKTSFLIFVKTGLLQYNTTNKGSRPEILDDPGERGGREKRVDDLQHHQQGTLLHVDVELPSRNFPQRDDIVGKTKPSVTRGRTIAKTRSGNSDFRHKS